ncbi:hypothetical protein AGLY_009402 [Aphis glycines]|uniref:Uncharacterized protein n=1 Tax=Aphis glycines TaxID=307491 RepID=A0A6G0TJI8_APHGL|nr:hypothetical protein AGLY_009402 [Aphis glycines]
MKYRYVPNPKTTPDKQIELNNVISKLELNENEQKININNNLLLCSLISNADYKLCSDLKPHCKVFRYPNRQKVRIHSSNLKISSNHTRTLLEYLLHQKIDKSKHGKKSDINFNSNQLQQPTQHCTMEVYSKLNTQLTHFGGGCLSIVPSVLGQDNEWATRGLRAFFIWPVLHFQIISYNLKKMQILITGEIFKYLRLYRYKYKIFYELPTIKLFANVHDFYILQEFLGTRNFSSTLKIILRIIKNFSLKSIQKNSILSKTEFCVKIPAFPILFFKKTVGKFLLLASIMHQGYSLCH